MKAATTKMVLLPASRPPDPQTSSRSFTLPPELRNEIYHLVFTQVSNDRKTVTLSNPSINSAKSPSALSLLQSCKLLRDEAEYLLFSGYHFCMPNNDLYTDPNTFGSFVRRTNPNRLAAIRSLEILVHFTEQLSRTFRNTKKLLSLRSLTVNATPLQVWVKDFSREMPLIKKAAKSLPMTIIDLKFVRPKRPETRGLWDPPDPDPKDHEWLEALFEKVLEVRRQKAKEVGVL